jgi:hypothetical protein
MNLSKLKPGEVIEAEINGQTIYGLVIEPKVQTKVGPRCHFEPITHNCSHRHAENTSIKRAAKWRTR